jgi:hypothetical protein
MVREHRRPAAGNTGFPDHDPSADVQPAIDVARQGSQRQGSGPAYTGRRLDSTDDTDAAPSQRDSRRRPRR